MISNQILQSSSTFSRICYYRFIPLLARFGSTQSKEASSSQNKSAKKSSTGKSSSEYLADDMYDYTAYSYYDIETTITKYRLPQPSSHAPLKPEPAPQKK